MRKRRQFYEKTKELKEKEYLDLMEMHMLELVKLPPEAQNEEGIILWMRFLGGRCEEDFRHMAEKDKYIEEAYDTLKKLSADEEKRLEYEARQKVIRDHNSFMKSAEKRGLQQGIQQGIQYTLKALELKKQNLSAEQIAEELQISLNDVKMILGEK